MVKVLWKYITISGGDNLFKYLVIKIILTAYMSE